MEVSKNDAKLMTILSPIITGINDIVGIFILLTKQFQYIFPQILGEVAVSILTSHKYIDKRKNFYNNKLRFK